MLGLYPGDVHGTPVGFWQASRRFVFGRLVMHAPCLDLYYFFVDCLCIGVLPGKRAIHDILACCVVRRLS